MIGREKRVLLRHYLEQGMNKAVIRNLSTTMGHSTGLIREQCPV